MGMRIECGQSANTAHTFRFSYAAEASWCFREPMSAHLLMSLSALLMPARTVSAPDRSLPIVSGRRGEMVSR